MPRPYWLAFYQSAVLVVVDINPRGLSKKRSGAKCSVNDLLKTSPSPSICSACLFMASPSLSAVKKNLQDIGVCSSRQNDEYSTHFKTLNADLIHFTFYVSTAATTTKMALTSHDVFIRRDGSTCNYIDLVCDSNEALRVRVAQRFEYYSNWPSALAAASRPVAHKINPPRPSLFTKPQTVSS